MTTQAQTDLIAFAARYDHVLAEDDAERLAKAMSGMRPFYVQLDAWRQWLVTCKNRDGYVLSVVVAADTEVQAESEAEDRLREYVGASTWLAVSAKEWV